jgi:hypothetical protein
LCCGCFCLFFSFVLLLFCLFLVIPWLILAQMLILGGRTEYYEVTRMPGELGISGGGGGGGGGGGSASVHSFSDAGNNSSFFSVDDFLCADFTIDLTAEEQDGTLCVSLSVSSCLF